MQLERTIEARIEDLEIVLETLGNDTPFYILRTLMVNYKLLHMITTSEFTKKEMHLKIKCLTFKI